MLLWRARAPLLMLRLTNHCEAKSPSQPQIFFAPLRYPRPVCCFLFFRLPVTAPPMSHGAADSGEQRELVSLLCGAPGAKHNRLVVGGAELLVFPDYRPHASTLQAREAVRVLFASGVQVRECRA